MSGAASATSARRRSQGAASSILALQVINERGEVVQEGEHRLMVETREIAQSAYAG